jgi:hypothetical protein
MKSLSQIRQSVITEASGGKEAYQKFFNTMLKKFGVKSAAELEGDKKKEFFDAIDAGWEGDNEEPEPGDKKESIKENMKNIAKALTSMASKPEYKKVAKSLESLAMRAKEGDKKAAKQIATQLDKMIMKVDKKSAAKLMKLADLATTYESVEEAVSTDCRTKGYKEAVKRSLLRQEKRAAKAIEKTLKDANEKLLGKNENMVASGSDATGNIAGKDMPLLKKKKVLKKFKDA